MKACLMAFIFYFTLTTYYSKIGFNIILISTSLLHIFPLIWWFSPCMPHVLLTPTYISFSFLNFTRARPTNNLWLLTIWLLVYSHVLLCPVFISYVVNPLKMLGISKEHSFPLHICPAVLFSYYPFCLPVSPLILFLLHLHFFFSYYGFSSSFSPSSLSRGLA